MLAIPCATQPCTLLQNDKVPAFIALEQINGHAHATDTTAYDHYSCICMILVADRHFGPWEVSSHCEKSELVLNCLMASKVDPEFQQRMRTSNETVSLLANKKERKQEELRILTRYPLVRTSEELQARYPRALCMAAMQYPRTATAVLPTRPTVYDARG